MGMGVRSSAGSLMCVLIGWTAPSSARRIACRGGECTINLERGRRTPRTTRDPSRRRPTGSSASGQFLAAEVQVRRGLVSLNVLISFKDGALDLIFKAGVLHPIPSWKSAARYLSPVWPLGGWLAVTQLQPSNRLVLEVLRIRSGAFREIVVRFRRVAQLASHAHVSAGPWFESPWPATTRKLASNIWVVGAR